MEGGHCVLDLLLLILLKLHLKNIKILIDECVILLEFFIYLIQQKKNSKIYHNLHIIRNFGKIIIETLWVLK